MSGITQYLHTDFDMDDHYYGHMDRAINRIDEDAKSRETSPVQKANASISAVTRDGVAAFATIMSRQASPVTPAP